MHLPLSLPNHTPSHHGGPKATQHKLADAEQCVVSYLCRVLPSAECNMTVQTACASSNQQSSLPSCAMHASLSLGASTVMTVCVCVSAGIAVVGRHPVATGRHQCSQRAVGPDPLCPGLPSTHSTRLRCADNCARLDLPSVLLPSQERHLQTWPRSGNQAVLGQLPSSVQQPAECGKRLLICQDCCRSNPA